MVGLKMAAHFDRNPFVVAFYSLKLLLEIRSVINEKKMWVIRGAHHSEPLYQLYPWVNPDPYVFIFRTKICGGSSIISRENTLTFAEHPKKMAGGCLIDIRTFVG